MFWEFAVGVFCLSGYGVVFAGLVFAFVSDWLYYRCLLLVSVHICFKRVDVVFCLVVWLAVLSVLGPV